jgi:hypothetical protein
MTVHILNIDYSDVFKLICLVFQATFSISRVLYLLSDHMECVNKVKQTRTEHAHLHISNTVKTQIQI